VDDYQELQWRLRALYGLKNFIGARIVAPGSAWGKYSPEAPQVPREKYRIEILEVSYDEAAKRIKGEPGKTGILLQERRRGRAEALIVDYTCG